MSEPEAVTELWTCMGVRVNGGHRVVVWETPEGELTYAERASYVTGGIYEVGVTRKEGHTYRSVPLYTRKWVDHNDPRRQAWQLAELAAEHELARGAQERKDKKAGFGALDKAMEPLVGLARECRTNAQRAALIADVIRRMNDCWR